MGFLDPKQFEVIRLSHSFQTGHQRKLVADGIPDTSFQRLPNPKMANYKVSMVDSGAATSRLILPLPPYIGDNSWARHSLFSDDLSFQMGYVIR